MDNRSSLNPKSYHLDLSKYRFEHAEEEVNISKELLENGHVNTSVSRSYYAIFYALLAVTELEGFEAAKHSAVISYFTFHYLRTKIFDGKLSKLIDAAFKLRRNADYEGFFLVSEDDAQKQINDAEKIINAIRPYLQSRWAEMEEKIGITEANNA